MRSNPSPSKSKYDSRAALVIQRTFRGYLGRKVFLKAVLERERGRLRGKAKRPKQQAKAAAIPLKKKEQEQVEQVQQEEEEVVEVVVVKKQPIAAMPSRHPHTITTSSSSSSSVHRIPLESSKNGSVQVNQSLDSLCGAGDEEEDFNYWGKTSSPSHHHPSREEEEEEEEEYRGLHAIEEGEEESLSLRDSLALPSSNTPTRAALTKTSTSAHRLKISHSEQQEEEDEDGSLEDSLEGSPLVVKVDKKAALSPSSTNSFHSSLRASTQSVDSIGASLPVQRQSKSLQPNTLTSLVKQGRKPGMTDAEAAGDVQQISQQQQQHVSGIPRYQFSSNNNVNGNVPDSIKPSVVARPSPMALAGGHNNHKQAGANGSDSDSGSNRNNSSDNVVEKVKKLYAEQASSFFPQYQRQEQQQPQVREVRVRNVDHKTAGGELSPDRERPSLDWVNQAMIGRSPTKEKLLNQQQRPSHILSSEEEEEEEEVSVPFLSSSSAVKQGNLGSSRQSSRKPQQYNSSNPMPQPLDLSKQEIAGAAGSSHLAGKREHEQLVRMASNIKSTPSKEVNSSLPVNQRQKESQRKPDNYPTDNDSVGSIMSGRGVAGYGVQSSYQPGRAGKGDRGDADRQVDNMRNRQPSSIRQPLQQPHPPSSMPQSSVPSSSSALAQERITPRGPTGRPRPSGPAAPSNKQEALRVSEEMERKLLSELARLDEKKALIHQRQQQLQLQQQQQQPVQAAGNVSEGRKVDGVAERNRKRADPPQNNEKKKEKLAFGPGAKDFRNGAKHPSSLKSAQSSGSNDESDGVAVGYQAVSKAAGPRAAAVMDVNPSKIVAEWHQAVKQDEGKHDRNRRLSHGPPPVSSYLAAAADYETNGGDLAEDSYGGASARSGGIVKPIVNENNGYLSGFQKKREMQHVSQRSKSASKMRSNDQSDAQSDGPRGVKGALLYNRNAPPLPLDYIQETASLPPIPMASGPSGNVQQGLPYQHPLDNQVNRRVWSRNSTRSAPSKC